uniref:Uncharacterized protein C19orf68 n=1 Tax=Cacopsylla melanoneura TaxID=428564 RepID=A0A8D8YCJ3_9HEMI
MKIGDRFSSWEEFFYHLKDYEDRVYSNYYVRDSKTLEAYFRRLKSPRATYNPALKYYFAFISCVKGGRNSIRKTKSIRKSRTGRIGCLAFMYLKATRCGQFLVIEKMNETHSHPVSQCLYKASAQQRLNIDEAVLRKYQNALVCHANKKVVQSKIFEETGKLLTLKDLTNMRSRVSRGSKTSEQTGAADATGVSDLDNSGGDPNTIIVDPNTMCVDDMNTAVANLITIDSNNVQIDDHTTGLCDNFIIASSEEPEQTSRATPAIPPSSLQKNIIDSVNLLQDVYKCEVHLFADYKRTPAAIYFQDEEMKRMFRAYPEIIFIDSIANLLDNKATIYLVVVEDSGGRGVIVAVGILLNEQQETLDWFFKKFKDTNSNSGDINVIMTDKDSTVRSSLRNLFPRVSLQICLFHTLQLFNHEISPNKMGISAEDTRLTKTYLKRLANCTTEHEYRAIYAEMMSQVPDVVCGYFNRNWESIREEWALYATCKKRGFRNKTNNKVNNTFYYSYNILERERER